MRHLTAGSAAVLGLLLVAGTAGCGSSTGATPAASSASSRATPSSASTAPAATATLVAASSTTAKATATPAPSDTCAGRCETIDLAAATDLIGAKPTALGTGGAGVVGDDDGGVTVTKLDGCAYTKTDPTLGYDVNRLSGAPAARLLAGAAAAMRARPGITVLTVKAGDAALGFVAPVANRYMARIEVAAGDTLIAVSAVGSDKAVEVARAATERLVAAFG